MMRQIVVRCPKTGKLKWTYEDCGVGRARPHGAAFRQTLAEESEGRGAALPRKRGTVGGHG